MRVPIAYKDTRFRSYAKHYFWVVRAYSKAEVEGDEENGELEVEGVVQIVVVDDDGGGQHDPDGYDHRRGKPRLWL